MKKMSNSMLGKMYPVLSLQLPAIELSSEGSTINSVSVPNQSVATMNFSTAPNVIETLPFELPLVPKKAQLPLVRERGVKKTIEDLANIFDLKGYQYNHVLFWYLDVLTDCLWRVQDEYNLQVEQQRVALSWVTFFLQVLKDYHMNYNRNEVFEILKEMVTLAGISMNEGDPYLSRPQDLARIMTIHDCFKNNKKEEQLASMINLVNPNDEIYYIDLRFDKIYLYILHRESPCSSGADISISIHKSMSSISYATESEEKKDPVIKEKNSDRNAEDKAELEQNLDIERLSVKTMLAVLDFIFEYFYDEFQYFLVRTALLHPPKYETEFVGSIQQPKKLYSQTRKKATSKVVTEEQEGQEHDLQTLLGFIQPTIKDYSHYIYPLERAITSKFWRSIFPSVSEKDLLI